MYTFYIYKSQPVQISEIETTMINNATLKGTQIQYT